MKSILIAVNVMLAILAGAEVIKCLTEKEDTMPARVSTAAKNAKETSRPIASTPAKASPVTHAIQRSPQQIEEQVNLISALNIFSSERTPDIPNAAKRTAANNASAEKSSSARLRSTEPKARSSSSVPIKGTEIGTTSVSTAVSAWADSDSAAWDSVWIWA